MSTVIVALRYYCRWFLMGTVSASDHLMFVALVVTWGNFVVNFYQDETSAHTRPSYLFNPEKRPLIEPQVRGNLISWWVYRLTYTIGLGFVKLSILFFYRAIAANRTFRKLVYATIAFVCMYTFAASMASTFQCENPSDAWSTTNYFAQFDRNPNVHRKPVKCFDPIKLWVFSSASNLITDIIILMLPLPTLLSLRIAMTKRLALIGIFSVGIMAITASSVRMWVMMLWAESPSNSARFGNDLLLWGQVETNSGIISASIPFLRLLFRSTQKEERSATPVKVNRVPSRPVQIDAFSQHKALDMGEWPLQDVKRASEQDNCFITIHEETVRTRGSAWGPFITIPESLSSASRGETLLEPQQHPHMTV
ncbi:uncharacterized protein J4E78_002611 [Alternaria triticimaculans]|uniref:uncharacterized protein n=1 Tax=Alternaria triticimaculans TaxID=297637 RepID=UPI0020C437CF|nr:uncharacterized protein J4E78_002611 [Alternaria triticimaculans]KAI4668783.1 hypothetical protein J4E78_002611 [Alternaria triticimaculans]